MKSSKSILNALAIVLLAGSVARMQAQMAGAGAPPGWNAAMTKLFGDVKAFSAKAEMSAFDKAGKETINLVLGFALLDEKVRLDIDMARMKGSQMPPGAAEQMKQLGMDKMAVLVFPEKKSMQLIYPSLKAYVDMVLPDEAAGSTGKDLKMEKTRLGDETVDGHPCAKNKVVVTDDKGQKTEATVWNATDLKDFPIQVRMNNNGDNVLIHYKDIKLDAPDDKQFAAPAGYAKHADMGRLMMSVMQKQMGNQRRQ